MDVTHDPDLLQDKRGMIDGGKFVSQSPLRSRYLWFVVTSNLACVIVGIVILFRHRGQIPVSGSWCLVTVCADVLICLFAALRYIQRMRAIYIGMQPSTIEVGSSADIALGIAAGTIFGWLLSISFIAFIVLLYFGLNF